MRRGFSVQGVEIEGFKGFTSPQAIDFKGRHVFMLGRNGKGKSSVVEAIRWGLFGSAFRPNEVVKNQHYSGGCRVTVKLVRDGELWTLRRTLNLGTGSSSDPVLTDQHGNRRPIREIMPQLDSVNAGEGTHVIFAAQSAPLRRQPEDLEPFEKTVLSYLGLTHPRALLSNVEDFLEDQAATEDELGEELTEVRHSLDGQIEEAQARRNSILHAPPWGDGSTPSIVASEQAVRSFIEDVTGNAPSDELEGLSLDALLESAERSLEGRRTRDQGSLEKQARDLALYRASLEELRGVQGQHKAQESKVRGTRAELEALCEGVTLEELRHELADAKREATTESVKARLAQDAIDLIRRGGDDLDILCPICDSPHDRQRLESALQSTVDHSDDMSSVVSSLEARVHESDSLEKLLGEQETLLHSLSVEADNLLNLLSDEDMRSLAGGNDVEPLIGRYSDREAESEKRIQDHDSWFGSKEAQLARLKEETRFQQILQQLNRLQGDKREIHRVIESYNDLVAFGESVRTIREVVESRLNEQLAQEIPRVSELLSDAFAALTQHPWYDRIVVAESDLPRLQLRAASTQDPQGREDPTGVLNGQAESALHLVPYFAFSQADDTPTEVYLVMLDDPTRASDTEHIRILVERLRDLGRNVQLIVASQEAERLLEMIPAVFDEGSYAIIEPTGWSPESGPSLKVRYE